MIDNAKWEVDFPIGIQEEQSVSLNLPIRDPALIGYIGKTKSQNCIVDKDDNTSYSVDVACQVLRIRHMVNTKTAGVESMAMLAPKDRLCEHVLLYLLAPKKADPKFVRIVRGEQTAPPAA